LSAVAENVKAATEGDVDKPLGRIVSNIEVITKDIAQLTTERKGQIGDIIENLHETTTTINDIINDESEEGFKASLHGALKSLRRIETSLKNVEEITGKINRGEGTIGKLVNDETTVEELNTAISGINNYLDAGNKLQSSIDFNSYYLTGSGNNKSTLALRLQPGLDRYYEIGIVNDAYGVSESTITKSTTGGVETTTREDKRYENKIKFNALFAKNFYDFSLKGGVIENSGGIGLDYYTFRRKLRLSLEAFDFTKTNLRASARFNVYNGIFLTAGGEDLLSKSGRTSAFVGGGLFLTNDDLKLLVSKLPF
jgi:phospholipid/cholesterol/gamma-HCH transport system substrate-binding protein